MTKDKNIFISVYLHKKGFVPAGFIVFNEQIGYAGFVYFESYIKDDNPPLNPATLNWRETGQRHFKVNYHQNKHMMDRTFWELLPMENDWGNQVLVARFPEYASMNHAQKLYFLGNRIVGGLSAYVKDKPIEENINSIDWLDKIREESVDFFNQNIEKVRSIKALNPMTSYGGFRPKCMYLDDNGDHWIAKFNLPNDPYNMAKVEQTALDMSRALGLNTSESKVLTLPSGEDVFLSKRFDREKEERFHSLSLYSLAEGTDKIKRNPFALGQPSSFIQTLIRRYSDFENTDTLNIVVKMLLDLGTNNTDNHLRNLRIILNKNNKWELAPIYDVVCNPNNKNHVYNPAGLPLRELYLNNPLLSDAMSKELGISKDLIDSKIVEAKNVFNNWEFFCDKNKLDYDDKNQVGKAINLGLNRKEYEVQKRISLDNTPKLKPNIKINI
jgi:hypothetical protein